MTDKNNIHEELQALRDEIQNLKQESKKTKIVVQEDIESTIKKFINKDNINELFETIKKDYKNISPVTAVGIFALGMMFGRSITKS